MTDGNTVTILGRTSHAMAAALAAVANGATPQAAAEAAGVRVDGLYKAMRRHGLRDRDRCPTCQRIMPKAARAPGA